MLQTHKKLLSTLLLTLLLSACIRPDSTPMVAVTPDQAVAATSVCLTPTAATRVLQHDVYGYCLLYPADYEVMRQAVAYAVAIWAPPATPGHRERLLINVQDAAGRTLEDVTQQFVTDYSIPGLAITVTTDLQIDGEPAAVIDPVPGQEFSRRALFVHAGLLYDLTFLPSDPQQPEAYAQMEALYTTVIESFTFLPVMQQAGEPGLVWQGQLDDGNTTTCKQLQLLRNTDGLLGSCDTADQSVQLGEKAAQEWAAILSLFAPFELTTPTEQMTFYGSGRIASAAWQRALAAWARLTYQELAAGQVSAAGNTALSWWLGEVPEQPGHCAHLLVLVYGYAYIRLEPCGGGEPLAQAESWLETGEWETFDEWLYRRASLYQEDNYFAGLGASAMTHEESDALAQWAAAVYARLVEATPAYKAALAKQ